MSENGPEDFGSEAGSEEAGSDAAEKAREILERIKGDSDPMSDEASPVADPPARDTADLDVPTTPVADGTDDDQGMLETAGAAVTGAVGGVAAAAEGLFDRAKDALDDIMDGDGEGEMLAPETGIEHVVGTSGGDDQAQTSWIGWMLGAAGIVLLLALLVSQCADASTRSSIESAGTSAVGQLGVAALMARNLFSDQR